MNSDNKKYTNLKNKIELYYLDSSFLNNPEAFNIIYDCLPDFRKKKIDDYYFSKDKNLSMAVWYLLTYALSQYDLNANSFDINYTSYGKPFLINCPIKFNLSHSGVMVFCALSLENIGCDVQHISSFDKNVAEYSLTDNELSEINKLKTDKDKEDRFYSLWTIKESIIKYTGLGLHIEPNKINVSFIKNYEDIRASVNYDYWNSHDFNIYKIFIEEDYSWACCDGNLRKSISVNNIEL